MLWNRFEPKFFVWLGPNFRSSWQSLTSTAPGATIITAPIGWTWNFFFFDDWTVWIKKHNEYIEQTDQTEEHLHWQRNWQWYWDILLLCLQQCQQCKQRTQLFKNLFCFKLFKGLYFIDLCAKNEEHFKHHQTEQKYARAKKLRMTHCEGVFLKCGLRTVWSLLVRWWLAFWLKTK